MKIKFVLIIAFVFSCFLHLYSQEYKYIYYFDKDLSSCKKSSSIITGKGLKENGLFRLDYFSNETGKLLLSVHFMDSTLSVMQGHFKSFYANTVVEQEGDYVQDLKEGLWQQWNENGFKTDSIIYEHSNRIRFAKFDDYNKKIVRRSYTYTDSLANTYVQIYYREKGSVSSEVFFKGERGLLKTYDSTGVITKTDSVFSRAEEEAHFTGGDVAWFAFLHRNLNTEVGVDNGAPNGLYNVVIKFRITKDGTLTDIEAETNLGYGTEKEAIRVIKKSPVWIPAKQYGVFVNAYRRQPVTFMVER